MSDALHQELLVYLARSNFDAPAINAFATLVERLRLETPEAERLALAERLRQSPPTNDVARLYSVLFHLTGDLYYLEHILHYYMLVTDQAEPEILHYTFWCIQRQLFLGRARPDRAASFSSCDMVRFYRRFIDAIARRWELRPAARPRPPGQALRRVAFVTNQFLGGRHQPSRDCFDFARLLQDKHGLEAVIVNGNLLPLKAVNLFMPPFSATLVDSFRGVQPVALFGDTVRMASFIDLAFSRDKLFRIIRAVENFRPDVIVGFGGTNVIADLFAMTGAVPTICLPTTTGLTMSLADIILGFDRHDWTADLPAAYRPPFAGRFRPFIFGYSLPPLSPEEDGYVLPDGAFVYAVVGNRLDEEVSADFLALLDRLLDRRPDAVVAFAGGVEVLPAQLAASRHAGRLLVLGHVADIRSFYRRCGAFLNPPRQGGGGGVAYALAEGLPVVSLPRGDGASVAGRDFLVADDAAFLDRAAALAEDPGRRAEMAEAARRRFADIGDRDRAAAELVGYCHEAIGG